jgi:hypothetical protein
MSAPHTVPRGLSLRAALRLAVALGSTVRLRRRHGELVASHPRARRPIVFSARRKDASLALIAWLRRLREG